MKVGIANDHAGTSLKNQLVPYLEKAGFEVVNYGTDSQESCDYPVYAEKLAKAIVNKDVERGIAICGTGIGISIAANKVHGIRCAACSETTSAKYARLHNDANIVALGARVIDETRAKEIVDVFLTTAFEGGRHQRRIDEIHALES